MYFDKEFKEGYLSELLIRFAAALKIESLSWTKKSVRRLELVHKAAARALIKTSKGDTPILAYLHSLCLCHVILV